jgi:drug/metabolite transporter (DMT)-like permease
VRITTMPPVAAAAAGAVCISCSAVLIIAVLAWLVLGERPSRSLVLASPVMLAGLVLVGGLGDTGRSHAYGTDPALGVGLGVGVAVLYAVYILMLRQATPTGSGAAVAPRCSRRRPAPRWVRWCSDWSWAMCASVCPGRPSAGWRCSR